MERLKVNEKLRDPNRKFPGKEDERIATYATQNLRYKRHARGKSLEKKFHPGEVEKSLYSQHAIPTTPFLRICLGDLFEKLNYMMQMQISLVKIAKFSRIYKIVHIFRRPR